MDLGRQPIAWPAAIVDRRPDEHGLDDDADDDAHPDDEHEQVEAFRCILGAWVERRLRRFAARAGEHRQADRHQDGGEAAYAQSSRTTLRHVTPASTSARTAAAVKYNPN